jgi:hypothetical protein
MSHLSHQAPGLSIALVQSSKPGGLLEIPPTPGLEVCGFDHGERRRKARKKVAVILAISHALRAHEALARPDALSPLAAAPPPTLRFLGWRLERKRRPVRIPIRER